LDSVATIQPGEPLFQQRTAIGARQLQALLCFLNSDTYDFNPLAESSRDFGNVLPINPVASNDLRPLRSRPVALQPNQVQHLYCTQRYRKIKPTKFRRSSCHTDHVCCPSVVRAT